MISEFFTERERVLMLVYKDDPDSLQRNEYQELIEAFDRFIDNPPSHTHRSLLSEAMHIVAILNGRVAGIDTQTHLKSISREQALW